MATKQEPQYYKLLPAWALHQENKSLLINGGADAIYQIELEDDEPSFFPSLKNSQSFTPSLLSLQDQRVLEELLTAEIVVPVLKKSTTLKVAVFGDENNLAVSNCNSGQSANILVIVRASSTYAELLEKLRYQNITEPHLLVDMAYHHTLSLGPLVFPGATACIACLQGRITTRWGDDAPPALPRAKSKYEKVVSGLLATELDRIANGDTSLTNKTVSWNFQDRTIRKDQLLKVPLCPICTKNRIDHMGALALPWRKDESTTNTV